MGEMIDSTPSYAWPSPMGLALIAYFQQDGASQMGWYERRAALLSARAKFSISRHLYIVYEAAGVDPHARRKSA